MAQGERELVQRSALANRRVAKLLPASINILVENAEQLSFEDSRTCLLRWQMLADLDGAHRDHELAHERRSATVAEIDGALFLRATGGTAEVAAEMEAIFQQTLEREFRLDVAERTRLHGADAASLLPRTDAQRRFDAMVSIFRRSVAVAPGAKAPTPVVNIDKWERDGGTTDPVNGGLGCGSHNRAKHRKYTAQRHRNGTVV